MNKSKHAKTPKPARRAPSKYREPLPVQLIDLARIDPSPLNRDPGNLDSLLASVRQYGVQQPIKLRPVGDRLEIVYGERRYQAAKKLRLPTIPATIEELSDADAQELRLVENLCRENPHPLDEAEAYEQLLAVRDARGKACHTVDTLAKLVGRSPQYVYGRLKLTALGPAMRAAFKAGELTVTTAFLVARGIPPDLQDQALAEFRDMFTDEGEGTVPFPLDELDHHIEQNYLTRLERAPFSLKDAKLVPRAGPCTTCAKRSGNQPDLFSDDIPKDTCSDATCFRAKLDAHREQLAAAVTAQGGELLTDQQSAEIFRGSYQVPWHSKHVDLDSRCIDDPDDRTWRELLGDLSPKVVLATDPRGVPHPLVLKTEALAALANAGVHLTSDDASDSGHRASASTDPAAARAAAKLRSAAIANILAAITAAAAARPPEDDTFARLIFDSMTAGGYHDAISDTVKRRALPRTKDERPEAALATHAQALDRSGIRALVLELATARGAYFAYASTYSEHLTAAATAYGIDIPAIEKKTADELEAACAQRSRKTRKAAA